MTTEVTEVKPSLKDLKADDLVIREVDIVKPDNAGKHIAEPNDGSTTLSDTQKLAKEEQDKIDLEAKTKADEAAALLVQTGAQGNGLATQIE